MTRDDGEHGHGGADISLIADLLGLDNSDPHRRASPEEARQAVLVADLASRSLAAGGRPVSRDEAGRDNPPPPPCASGSSLEMEHGQQTD